ncbi:putative protein-disulfide isomerase [Hasllibacter halocynthiae]|uniref:DSBA-like thioredoxin domain-containing protein n=1 Tax=Hasllibacter halocynthiae TaxID=595589 RepID=A0A2T0X159_9RHOB|nr:hypothetical protein [Hasllibacter halocynthiae]PRY92625.1 putative protein-disulfide isomerase [Hasllibacter halocynthiae]
MSAARELIYGYDPICGWCYGAAPAVRAAAEVVPVRVVMAGLVTGDRVGPAAAMEGYVRGAAGRLRAVTGRAPSEAFFEWMRSPGAVADSGPPAVAVDAVRRERPGSALAFACAVTEAHYAEGMDPNDPGAYAPLLDRHAPGVVLPDIHDPGLQDAAFAEGREMGITAFPTFALRDGGRIAVLPTIYDPPALVAALGA